MKSWFPFTDYDFYAYLASGFTLLFALDYAITGGEIMLRDKWTFVEIVFAVAIAYVAGQVAATPSSTVIEHWFARKVISPPLDILLGIRKPRRRERFVARAIIGRYYEPLPEQVREVIFKRAAEELGAEVDDVQNDAEAVFQPAYALARRSGDTQQRLDGFRNQYGFNRNMAFVGIIATIAIGVRALVLTEPISWVLAGLALVLTLGLLGRFLKFYAAFAAEVLRSLSVSSAK